MKKVNLDIINATKNIKYNIYLEEAGVSCLKKISIRDEYEYSNIRIKLPLHIIRICGCSE